VLNSATSVLERRLPISDTHHTHPYEAGWASEAVLFVQTEGAHPPLRLQPEMSPDGLVWVPLQPATAMTAEQSVAGLQLRHFGGWIRLTITGPTAANPATVLIHLALKG